MVRIFEIEMYRDGGSIEFRIDGGGATKHVWLDTPFKGEPRALFLDSIKATKGMASVRQLRDGIDEWWESLPPPLQTLTLEVLSQKEPFFNPNAERLEAGDVSRVLKVRDYINQNYLD